MSLAEKYVAEFELLTGIAFQDEVCARLQETDPSFQTIPTKDGDGGLDGLSSNGEIPYCCFGHEYDPAKTQAQYNEKIVEKFSSDLRRLLELKSIATDISGSQLSIPDPEIKEAADSAIGVGTPKKKKKELVHADNKELAAIIASGVKIKHIKLVLNRFESNKVLGKLQTALKKYITASKCAFVEATVSLVIIGPKQLANEHYVDELTLSRAKHRILAKKVEQAAINIALNAQDQKTFDTKMAMLKELRPNRDAAVDGMAETFREDWRTALACEKELSDEASTLHYALEQGRRTLLAKIQMKMYASNAPWDELPNAVQLAEEIFGSSLGSWWGDLKSAACRGEVARLIGDCPIGWDGLDKQSAH
jgi:hypothetical protein